MCEAASGPAVQDGPGHCPLLLVTEEPHTPKYRFREGLSLTPLLAPRAVAGPRDLRVWGRPAAPAKCLHRPSVVRVLNFS